MVGNFPYVTGVVIECCVPNYRFFMPKAGAPSRVQEDVEILQNWAISRGASARQAERIVALLSVEFICALLLPPRTYKKPGIASPLVTLPFPETRPCDPEVDDAARGDRPDRLWERGQFLDPREALPGTCNSP